MRSLPYLVNTSFYIFLTGLFLLPFIYSIEPRVEYEPIKVVFFQRWVEAIWVTFLLFSAEKFSINKLLNKLNLLLVSFYLASLLASYLGADYSKSFWGNTYRNDGLFTLLHFILLFYYIQLAWEDKWKKNLVMTIVASSLIASLYALGKGWTDYIYGMYKYNFSAGLTGTLGHPAFLGGFLLLTLPFYMDVKNLTFTIPGFIPVLAILFTFSRFSIFGILLIPVMRTLLQRFKIKPSKIFYVFLIFSILYFSFFALKAITVTQEYKAGNNFVYEDRMRIYTKGFLGFLQKPILGFGYANFDKAFESVDWPTFVPKDVYVDKAHSVFLETLTTTGILGFILLLTFYFLLFNRLNWGSSFNTAITISFLLYLLNATVNITSVSQDVYFWLFAGILTKEE